MISKACMKLKQGYIFHKNANYIPSTLLYKEEWFGRSLEERRPNNSFVTLPWKYKYKQSTSCFHRLQSFTAQKHHKPWDVADPGNSRIQLLPPFWNFPWNVDHLFEIQHALTAMLSLFWTCLWLSFSVSAGNRSRNTEMPHKRLCDVSLFLMRNRKPQKLLE